MEYSSEQSIVLRCRNQIISHSVPYMFKTISGDRLAYGRAPHLTNDLKFIIYYLILLIGYRCPMYARHYSVSYRRTCNAILEIHVPKTA